MAGVFQRLDASPCDQRKNSKQRNSNFRHQAKPRIYSSFMRHPSSIHRDPCGSEACGGWLLHPRVPTLCGALGKSCVELFKTTQPEPLRCFFACLRPFVLFGSNHASCSCSHTVLGDFPEGTKREVRRGRWVTPVSLPLRNAPY